MTGLETLSKDGALVVGTITKAEWERARAQADEVHVVRFETHTGGDE